MIFVLQTLFFATNSLLCGISSYCFNLLICQMCFFLLSHFHVVFSLAQVQLTKKPFSFSINFFFNCIYRYNSILVFVLHFLCCTMNTMPFNFVQLNNEQLEKKKKEKKKRECYVLEMLGFCCSFSWIYFAFK